ncbi:MAG TPA: response regulator transcription factor [Chitinophagaceae bacterium]|jgi:DNA-binding response OmpR family regulator
MKILVIEDERELSESICEYLANEQFICERAGDYASGLEKISMHDYACIVLDINLPGGSGIELLNELKRDGKADGVLIVSARNALDDKVNALESGADDYLTKPFHLAELAARVNAIIRRKTFDGSNRIQCGDVLVDLNEKSVHASGHLIELTRKEYDLLLYFLGNRNRVISKEAIAEHLWGDNMEGAGNFDFIYTHIKNLRKKLMHAGAPDYIRSVYGMGYKFSV